MRQVFKKANYRSNFGDLTCEVVRQLDKIGLTIGAETLCAVIKTNNTKFETNDGEGSSVIIETRYSYSRVSNELERNGSISLIWNTRSDHTVKISESWFGIPSLGGFIIVEIGEDKSEQFYPSVTELLGEIPLLDERYASGEEKIVVAVQDKFRYNGKTEEIGPSMTSITIDMARKLAELYPGVLRLRDDVEDRDFSDEEKLPEIKKYLWEEVEKNHPEYGPNHGAYGSANEVCRIFYNRDIVSLLEKNPRGIFLEVPHKVFDEWLNRSPFVHRDWA